MTGCDFFGSKFKPNSLLIQYRDITLTETIEQSRAPRCFLSNSVKRRFKSCNNFPLRSTNYATFWQQSLRQKYRGLSKQRSLTGGCVDVRTKNKWEKKNNEKTQHQRETVANFRHFNNFRLAEIAVIGWSLFASAIRSIANRKKKQNLVAATNYTVKVTDTKRLHV